MADINVPDIQTLSRDRLEEMQAAGNEIRECYRVLEKADLNIVGECLRGQGTFYEMDHYPEGDVYDSDTFCQYYYHNHRGLAGEHGHFHSFVRAKGMPDGVEPVDYQGPEKWPEGNDRLAHLVAISMDPRGYPTGMFATNRWVTDENIYPAADVEKMIDNFAIDHASPNWPVNRWLTAMFKLFRPQVVALLEHRDIVLDEWAKSKPDVDVYEDRELETTGELIVSVDRQIKAVEKALAA